MEEVPPPPSKTFLPSFGSLEETDKPCTFKRIKNCVLREFMLETCHDCDRLQEMYVEDEYLPANALYLEKREKFFELILYLCKRRECQFRKNTVQFDDMGFEEDSKKECEKLQAMNSLRKTCYLLSKGLPVLEKREGVEVDVTYDTFRAIRKNMDRWCVPGIILDTDDDEECADSDMETFLASERIAPDPDTVWENVVEENERSFISGTLSSDWDDSGDTELWSKEEEDEGGVVVDGANEKTFEGPPSQPEKAAEEEPKIYMELSRSDETVDTTPTAPHNSPAEEEPTPIEEAMMPVDEEPQPSTSRSSAESFVERLFDEDFDVQRCRNCESEDTSLPAPFPCSNPDGFPCSFAEEVITEMTDAKKMKSACLGFISDFEKNSKGYNYGCVALLLKSKMNFLNRLEELAKVRCTKISNGRVLSNEEHRRVRVLMAIADNCVILKKDDASMKDVLVFAERVLAILKPSLLFDTDYEETEEEEEGRKGFLDHYSEETFFHFEPEFPTSEIVGKRRDYMEREQLYNMVEDCLKDENESSEDDEEIDVSIGQLKKKVYKRKKFARAMEAHLDNRVDTLKKKIRQECGNEFRLFSGCQDKYVKMISLRKLRNRMKEIASTDRAMNKSIKEVFEKVNGFMRPGLIFDTDCEDEDDEEKVEIFSDDFSYFDDADDDLFLKNLLATPRPGEDERESVFGGRRDVFKDLPYTSKFPPTEQEKERCRYPDDPFELPASLNVSDVRPGLYSLDPPKPDVYAYTSNYPDFLRNLDRYDELLHKIEAKRAKLHKCEKAAGDCKRHENVERILNEDGKKRTTGSSDLKFTVGKIIKLRTSSDGKKRTTGTSDVKVGKVKKLRKRSKRTTPYSSSSAAKKNFDSSSVKKNMDRISKLESVKCD